MKRERVEWIVAMAADFCEAFRSSSHIEVAAVALELRSFLPSMQKVVAVARRVQVAQEKVPASEKVFEHFRAAHGVDHAWQAR